MSAGIYALIGVVVGGLLSVGGQATLTWWQAKKAGEAEWLVASRLVSEELLLLMHGLRVIIDYREPPGSLHFFETPIWTEYREVIARHLKNDDAGDAFWRALSNLNAQTAPALRHGLESLSANADWPDALIAELTGRFKQAAQAYEDLTGVKPEVSLQESLAGAQTGTQQDEPA